MKETTEKNEKRLGNIGRRFRFEENPGTSGARFKDKRIPGSVLPSSEVDEATATPVILSPDLVALMHEMGLTWDEVRIYQFLLNSSSAISSAVVRETGHSRGRIYEALRRLVEKGVVREEPTRPIRFHPTPLVEILATTHARLSRQLDAVKEGQGMALALDNQVAVPLFAPTRPRDVCVLSGRRACHREWTRMLGEAQRFFWLTGGERLAARLADMPDLLRQMRAKLDDGLDIQVVLPCNEATADAFETMRHLLGPDVLHAATVDSFGPLVSCATDRASMDVISQPDDDSVNRGDDIGIQVSSELFAQAAHTRRELAEAFQHGDRPAPFQWLGPERGSELFLDAVRNAQKEVLVLGPTAWSTFLARDWQRNAVTYREAKGRGVRFRALTQGARQTLDAFAHIWEIRVVPWHPVWLTIIDGRELYQAFTDPSRVGPPQFRHSREPNEIRFYVTLFDRLWDTGEST